MYGWLQVLLLLLNIFSLLPYCFLGNIYFSRFCFRTLEFLFFLFFLDICTITWQLSANGLRERIGLARPALTDFYDPRDKLLVAETTQHENSWSNKYRCGQLLCIRRCMLDLVGVWKIIKTVLECCFTLTWFYFYSAARLVPPPVILYSE